MFNDWKIRSSSPLVPNQTPVATPTSTGETTLRRLSKVRRAVTTNAPLRGRGVSYPTLLINIHKIVLYLILLFWYFSQLVS